MRTDMISPPASPACGPLPSDMGMITVDSADLAADCVQGVEMSATGERNADRKSAAGPDDAGDVETRRSRQCALWSRDDVPLLQSSLVCPLSLPALRALRVPTCVNTLVLDAPVLGLMVC